MEGTASTPGASTTSQGLTSAGSGRLKATRRKPKVAVFIDVANADGVDFRQLLARASELGHVAEVRAYGDFRQRHLDQLAIELYVLGVEMVHCPSWPNGGRNEDGTTRRKRTDDRLLEKEVRDLVSRRPSICSYILVTSDADIIPTCHTLRQHGKGALLMCPAADSSLGHVLRQSSLGIEPAPMLEAPEGPGEPSKGANAGSAGLGRLVQELECLETNSDYLTFSYVSANIGNNGNGLPPEVMANLNLLIEQGAVERYPHPHPRTGQTLPAIRLNRAHPLVVSALQGVSGALPGATDLHGGDSCET